MTKRNLPKEAAINFLKQLGPLVKRGWISCYNDGSQTSRTKFTSTDDALLLLGLKKFGSKYPS
jgi:hypothetical protein